MRPGCVRAGAPGAAPVATRIWTFAALPSLGLPPPQAETVAATGSRASRESNLRLVGFTSISTMQHLHVETDRRPPHRGDAYMLFPFLEGIQT
jgi:hypothetical protein